MLLLGCALAASAIVQHAADAAEHVVHLVTEDAQGRFRIDPNEVQVHLRSFPTPGVGSRASRWPPSSTSAASGG